MIARRSAGVSYIHLAADSTEDLNAEPEDGATTSIAAGRHAEAAPAAWARVVAKIQNQLAIDINARNEPIAPQMIPAMAMPLPPPSPALLT